MDKSVDHYFFGVVFKNGALPVSFSFSFTLFYKQLQVNYSIKVECDWI